jgi:hypothetical protein
MLLLTGAQLKKPTPTKTPDEPKSAEAEPEKPDLSELEKYGSLAGVFSAGVLDADGIELFISDDDSRASIAELFDVDDDDMLRQLGALQFVNDFTGTYDKSKSF